MMQSAGSVFAVGGQRMGPGGQGLQLGQRVNPPGSMDGQHLARALPLGKSHRRWLVQDLPRGPLPRQRLRAGGHGGQCLGVNQYAIPHRRRRPCRGRGVIYST